MIRLIIALGNPGRTYEQTRHNIGQRILIEYLEKRNSLPAKKKFYSRYAVIPEKHHHFILPETYMNQSGKAAEAARSFLSLSCREVLVIHDDIEAAFGRAAFLFSGGLKGHKGLRSIAQAFSSRDFFRLAVGVGRPEKGSVSSHVLQQFSKEQLAWLPQLLDAASAMLDEILQEQHTPGTLIDLF